MFNIIKKFKEFLDFCKEILVLYYGKHFILVSCLSVLLCLFLTMFYQDSTYGMSMFVGFCFLVSILFFNDKAFKGKVPQETY